MELKDKMQLVNTFERYIKVLINHSTNAVDALEGIFKHFKTIESSFYVGNWTKYFFEQFQNEQNEYSLESVEDLLDKLKINKGLSIERKQEKLTLQSGCYIVLTESGKLPMWVLKNKENEYMGINFDFIRKFFEDYIVNYVNHNKLAARQVYDISNFLNDKMIEKLEIEKEKIKTANKKQIVQLSKVVKDLSSIIKKLES